jgi:hypothetical protein
VSGDCGGRSECRQSRSRAGRDERADGALGDIERSGDCERGESGNAVQRRSRDRSAADGTQIDATTAGRHLRPRHRAGEEGTGEDRCRPPRSVRPRHGRTLQNCGIDQADQPAGTAPDDTKARRRRHRRFVIISSFTFVALVVAGLIAAAIIFSESITPVDVGQAISEFRSDTGDVDEPGTALPEPGVYTYATSGRESIDALDGRHHDYPAETTITVRHEGCGAKFTWRPLTERFDDTVLCPEPAGVVLPSYRSHHEFFGMDDDRAFMCEPGSFWYPATTAPGTTWTVRCADDDVHVLRTGTMTGLSEVEVAGEVVEVLTFELHDEITGASVGTNERMVKVLPDTGLIVELAASVDVRSDSPIGDVHYLELYRLNLTSLTPRR